MIALLQDSTSYQVVYDVRHAFPEAVGIAFCTIIIVAIGAILYRNAHRFSSSRVGFIGVGFIIVGGLATLFVVAGTVLPYIGLRSHLARGRYRVVEGIVRNFVPGDAGDHRSESWSLESSSGMFHYSYNPAIIGDGGYDQTAAHGGHIRDGKRVRVIDVDRRIARLEIAR